MRSTDGFRDFVLDQLSSLKGVRARAMFGGIGLYADDTFFGIIASDVLYFKVDDTNRAPYESAGSRAFKPYADREMTMPYYNVPIGVLEHPETVSKWAKASIQLAKSKKKKS
jgi:DNA transformation protein